MSTGVTVGMAPALIWRGRLHLGDEPGVYGDANYVGLCTEWPITLQQFDPASGPGSVIFRVIAEDVRVFSPYPGHRITLWRYVPAPTPDNPYAWSRTQIDPASDHRLTNKELSVEVDLPDDAPTVYMSLRVEVDTGVQPGLYDEFVVTRLILLSISYYSSLGFRFE